MTTIGYGKTSAEKSTLYSIKGKEKIMLKKKDFQIVVIQYRREIKKALLLLGFITIYILIEFGLGWFGIFLYQHNLPEIALVYLVLYAAASLFAIAIVPNELIEIIIPCIVDEWEKRRK